MKKNILTFIYIIALSISVSTFAQAGAAAPAEPLDQGGSYDNGTWYFNNPGGENSALFGSTPTIPENQLVPVGTQEADSNSNQVAGGDVPTLSVQGLSQWFLKLLGYAVQLILALALVSFLYGIFRLVFLDASNEEGRNKARKFMLWGIVALFVMVSVWGLVNVLQSSVFGAGGGLIVPGFK